MKNIPTTLWSVGLKVVLGTDTPISAVELYSSFGVIFGIFVASLINALLAWSVSFGGRYSLGRFAVVPYSWHFLIMNLMVLRGMFKVLDIFLEPNPHLCFSKTSSLTCLESSLVFMGPLAWCCPLVSGVADSGAFQNRCVYTELMWQIIWHRLRTGGLYLTNYVIYLKLNSKGWIHMHAPLFHYLFFHFTTISPLFGVCPLHEI